MLIKHLSEPSGIQIPNESHINITLSFHETSKIRALAFALTLWTVFRGNELLLYLDNEESKAHPKSDLLSLSLS